MADFHSTSPPPQLPNLQRHDTSGGMSIATDIGNPPPPEKDDVHDPATRNAAPDADHDALDHHYAAASLPSQPQQPALNPETAKQVSDVLGSEVMPYRQAPLRPSAPEANTYCRLAS